MPPEVIGKERAGTSPDNDYRFTVIVEGAAVPVEFVGFSIE